MLRFKSTKSEDSRLTFDDHLFLAVHPEVGDYESKKFVPIQKADVQLDGPTTRRRIFLKLLTHPFPEQGFGKSSRALDCMFA